MSFIPYLKEAPTHGKSGMSTAETSNGTIDTSKPDAVAKTTSNNDPYGPRIWNSNLVSLSGKNRAINEFTIEREGEPVEENLVILHGYGAGLGFFYKNFEGLSRVRGWKLYALDMLGMGRSSRPTFKIHAKDQAGKISEAESWFIDALEEWRIIRQIDRFTLMGHSMGGYMATAYALKYPGHLDKLILASPVGIPEDPDAVSADMPEPQESTMANEFTDEQEEFNPEGQGVYNSFVKSRTKMKKEEKVPKRKIPTWITYLWDANLSPFSVVRWAGPLGPRLVSGWTSRRFNHLGPDESKALHDYAYSLFRQRGSGEFVLAYILAPGAFARSPLIRRIQGVGRQYIPDPKTTIPPSFDATEAKHKLTKCKTGSKTNPSTSSTPSDSKTSLPSSSLPGSSTPELKRETGYPIILMYGENDWMDVAGGLAAEQKIKEEKERILADPKTTDEEKKLENGRAEVVIIKNAGHHLYLEGWEEFNEVIRKQMVDVQQTKKRLARITEHA